MSDQAVSNEPTTLASRLGASHVEVRRDLDISRRVLRGEVCYAVVDPITLQAHRLTAGDYDILVALSLRQSLAEVFAELVRAKRLAQDDEERFYQFVISLHKQSLLKLPISDEKILYQRHQAKIALQAKKKHTSLLAYRVPLCNPDAFLSRTLVYVRPLFSKAAFAAWVVLVCAASVLVVENWHELHRPVAEIVTGENLAILWLSVIALKVMHELGHGYACKLFGGEVPGMGVTLIMLTPCAYVDTTSAWGFKRKRDRLIVCLAGMYVELAVAAVAMIAWSMVPPGVGRGLLHNIVLLASVATVGFNLNPFMRHDGYYALADVLEIPNLRQRANQHATRTLKRLFLGIKSESEPVGFSHGPFLLAFGIASGMCKVMLVIGIATLIATKFVVAGVLVGAVYFGNELWRVLRRLIPYLWSSRETEGMQLKARTLGWLIMLGLPLALLAIPVRSGVRSTGVVRGQDEAVIRADVSGFVSEISVRAGQEIDLGAPLVELDDPERGLCLLEVNTRLESSRLRRGHHHGTDLLKVREEEARATELEHERALRERELASLTVRSPARGTVVECLKPADVGRYVARGEALATVAGSTLVVTALFTEEELADAKPLAGQRVEFRSLTDPTRTWPGTIERIAPRGQKSIDPNWIEHLNPGRFEYDPAAQTTSRSLFEVEVTLDESLEPGSSVHGATGELSLTGAYEPIAMRVWRSVLSFASYLQI